MPVRAARYWNIRSASLAFLTFSISLFTAYLVNIYYNGSESMTIPMSSPNKTVLDSSKPTRTSTEFMQETTPVSTEEFRSARPQVVGRDEGPEQPFPLALHGAVQTGFGRGGKELGCPTANLPGEALRPLSSVTHTGIYFGFAQISPRKENPEQKLSEEDSKVHPMVMSLGWNPFYKNERLSAEVHIMHKFKHDFYGYDMRVLLLGYIRPELDYTSREALIDDIETDKQVALRSLSRSEYAKYANDSVFSTFTVNQAR